ncbi:MAG: hypothetical protein ACLGJB_21935 [Blastocatellia bacterium]
MSKDTDKNLFIGSSLPRLYQQLFKGIASYDMLGNRIIERIKIAHAFRQVDQVRELSSLLLSLPIREHQLIAQYYLVWCDLRESKYDTVTLEGIIDSTQTYKTKALSTKAAFEIINGRPDAAMYFYLEALKSFPTASEYIHVSRAIAVLKAQEGFHNSALKDLEGLIPMLRYAEPLVCYDVLNSYAAQLSEAKRKDEARKVSKLVVASPFAFAYPEWQETARELRGPDHSFITAPSIERKPAGIEAIKARPAGKESRITKPDRAVSPPRLKEAPEPKRPKPLNPHKLGDMTSADKREFILTAVRTELLSESEYNKFIFMLGLVKGGPAAKVIDLEDEKVLGDLMLSWAHLVEPGELAGVMSALRDCEDGERRNNILDNMIRKVFEYSRVCNITELDWRRQFERRLPKK